MTAVERAFIGGERVQDTGAATFASIDPATEKVIAQVAQTSHEQVDAAVQTAATAQREWARRSVDSRASTLWRWGELILAAGDELAQLDTYDIGRPISDSTNDPAACARATRYWAGMAEQIRGDQLPTAPGHLSYTVREPIGVVAIILPWNGPMLSLCNRVAPALACGNGVVVKPSEWSPMSAGLLAELALDAGLPAGLLNVVLGDGRVGAALVEHRDVGGVSFTGSVATGRTIARAAAGKTITMELGGKSANIVFADADLETAIDAAVWGVFANTGQVCCAGTRLIVERSIADEFVTNVAQRSVLLRVGDPLDPQTQLGPVASKTQYDRVNRYLDDAVSGGARMATGGGRPADAGEVGYYIAPTVVCDAAPGSGIVREEIFGPVLAVQQFEDEAEAVGLANDSRYGLAANIWTENAGRMLRVADQLEVGTVWGNTSRVMDPALPFGGFKDSGVGNAYGDAAVEGLTRLKRVSVRYGTDTPVPRWPR
ncbi:MAG: (Z)-2-((N-methylformamido)methylene)-5-hydroxybutyrolactone dehydrogenase [Pseudonocardiales bacterium]|jgi:acyl-CoA reductase-like NAD-dependent aldehyde dehydrogenase|nr:(Z)-2-((N-methylformamido)methylene)-5-hydroxybutyrolactone dehydrogenase [Pseudonocardiales bacterium]MDT4980236.1 (Z)-2-((N-methylformamido)methylene)-5-hydroxybutyrolactone dehydrogenase [Pseudonocardiales bacterium]